MGARAGQPAAANNVRGAIADEVVLQELAALRKQKANGSWHVVGLDSKLDAAILSADEHTAIGELKHEADAQFHNGSEGMDDDEEIKRMREEIEMLDKMAAIMRERPASPQCQQPAIMRERPQSPHRRAHSHHPSFLHLPAPDTDPRNGGGHPGNYYPDAGMM